MAHFESSRQSRLHVSRALKTEALAVADENDLETRSCRTWNVRDLHIWQLPRYWVGAPAMTHQHLPET